MKAPFNPTLLPADAVFLVCSSHEDRCLGIVRKWGDWRPRQAVIFHYDDPNPRREENHKVLLDILNATCNVTEIPFTEANAVLSFHDQRNNLLKVVTEATDRPVIVDISVFTKRHLLMLLRWLGENRGTFAPSVSRSRPLRLIFARFGGSAMSAARKSASLCVQNWRSRSAFIRKLVLQNNLRPGASPPHASLQLGGLALPVTSGVKGQGSGVRGRESEVRSQESGRRA